MMMMMMIRMMMIIILIVIIITEPLSLHGFLSFDLFFSFSKWIAAIIQQLALFYTI